MCRFNLNRTIRTGARTLHCAGRLGALVGLLFAAGCRSDSPPASPEGTQGRPADVTAAPAPATIPSASPVQPLTPAGRSAAPMPAIPVGGAAPAVSAGSRPAVPAGAAPPYVGGTAAPQTDASTSPAVGTVAPPGRSAGRGAVISPNSAEPQPARTPDPPDIR